VVHVYCAPAGEKKVPLAPAYGMFRPESFNAGFPAFFSLSGVE
jgi:hypothetical protein